MGSSFYFVLGLYQNIINIAISKSQPHLCIINNIKLAVKIKNNVIKMRYLRNFGIVENNFVIVVRIPSLAKDLNTKNKITIVDTT